MAFHFLGLSPTYVFSMNLKSFRQQEATCARLKETYKAIKGGNSIIFAEVKDELAREGIEFTGKEYRKVKGLLRGLFLWLRATTEKDRSKAIKGIQRRATEIIRWLREDNIRSWSDIIALAPKGVVSEFPQVKEEESEEPRIMVDRRARLRELGAEEKTLNLIEELWPALEAMLEENQFLKKEITRGAEELARIRSEGESAQELIVLLEGDNESLEARLRAAQDGIRRAHSTSLEEIAEQYPDVPQLFALAQQLKQGKGQRQKDILDLATRLPHCFAWANEKGSIKYEERFVRLLTGIALEEQLRFIRQIEILATQGPEYASLHTRKNEGRIPFSPSPCFSSRGTDVWRFTWAKNGEITFYWLYRKGDSSIRQSEA